MEVAPRGSGDHPVTRRGPRDPRVLGLLALVLVLLLACVFGGVLAVVEHRDRVRATAEQERYGAVLAAARSEMEAFVNIDYRDAQASIAKVAAGATGDFAKQYGSSTKNVQQILEQAKSVMDGKVLWAGVVDVDADSATVIVATTGTVANTSTQGKPVARDFRIKVDLVDVDGTWKTSNVEFVG